MEIVFCQSIDSRFVRLSLPFQQSLSCFVRIRLPEAVATDEEKSLVASPPSRSASAPQVGLARSTGIFSGVIEALYSPKRISLLLERVMAV